MFSQSYAGNGINTYVAISKDLYMDGTVSYNVGWCGRESHCWMPYTHGHVAVDDLYLSHLSLSGGGGLYPKPTS